MSNQLVDNKNYHDSVKSNKVLLTWRQANDYLATTVDLDIKKMSQGMIKLLHACARAWVNQFELGRPTSIYMIDTALCDNPKLAERIKQFLFLKPLPTLTKTKEFINNKSIKNRKIYKIEMNDL